MSTILGLSAFYHDSAAALLRDGAIVAAAQEERFSRRKYDARFPSQAIAYCLAEAASAPEDLDYVAFYEQPLTKFERLIETYVTFAPQGFSSFRRAVPLWLNQKLHIPREIRRGLGGRFRGRILFPSHHESHAASAFFPSPFEEAAILTLDGVGEWATTTIGRGRGNRIEILEEIRFPHSLGLLYSAFTYYCGFKVNAGEYKLMGLAPYGEPRFVDRILETLIDLKDDGSYALDQSYFNYCAGLTMTNDRFHRLFGGPPREPESRLEQRHMDLAASIQRVCEEVVLRSARHAWERTGRPRYLVLAGGVALNCVANGRLLREGPFEDLWIQPASGDAGGSLGAALFAWHQILGKPRQPEPRDSQRGSLLGPHYTRSEVEATLQKAGARYQVHDDEASLVNTVADHLASGAIVGWFQGRAEFGPRALGCRSILGDPRNPRMQADLNLKIKFRESFRPFAPCVLQEHVQDWFAMRAGQPSPYMLLVAPVLERHRTVLDEADAETLRHDPDLARRVNIVRSSVPAITHVDYSARIQTVDERHGRFRELLQAFYARTGCPILVNTSFNLSWGPIVLTPAEAYRTFMQSEMDVLVLGDCVLRKSEQPLGFALSNGVADPTAPTPWVDPKTGEVLIVRDEALVAPTSGTRYPIRDGIPRLGPSIGDPSSSRDRETPPVDGSEDDVETLRSLVETCRDVPILRDLSERIPYKARVVEIGCGSGRLTSFLATAHRAVLGIDDDPLSLARAQRFATAHRLDRAAFAEMDLEHPALRHAFFDVVLATGVLVRTHDLGRTLTTLARLLRPGGLFLALIREDSGRSPLPRSDPIEQARAIEFATAPHGVARGSIRELGAAMRSAGIPPIRLVGAFEAMDSGWFPTDTASLSETDALAWPPPGGLRRGIQRLAGRGGPYLVAGLRRP